MAPLVRANKQRDAVTCMIQIRENRLADLILPHVQWTSGMSAQKGRAPRASFSFSREPQKSCGPRLRCRLDSDPAIRAGQHGTGRMTVTASQAGARHMGGGAT